MKTAKLKNVIMTIVLVISGIISICGYKIAITHPKSALSGTRIPVQKLESFSAQSEFYYRPAGETRIWHVINNYSELNSDNGKRHNMSFYTFNSDSVLVINQYAGIPDQNQWDVTLANFLLNGNNFNN